MQITQVANGHSLDKGQHLIELLVHLNDSNSSENPNLISIKAIDITLEICDA